MQLTAKFDDSLYGGVTIELVNDDNQVKKKTVSVEDFIDSLANATKKQNEFIRVGKLPYGYYDAAFSVENDSFKCVTIIPKGKQTVKYKDLVFCIPFPSLAFYFEVLKGNLTNSCCYAIADTDHNDNTSLYRYPFGNVYDDGDICWGNNQIEYISNIKKIENIITLFYCLPTNDDMYSCGKNIAVCDITLNLQGFYTKLQEMDKFPEELLINTSKELGMLL